MNARLQILLKVIDEFMLGCLPELLLSALSIRNSPEVGRFIATLIAVSSSVPLAFHQCAHLHTKTPNHLQTHTNMHFGNPPSSLLSGVAGSQEVGDDNTAAVFSSSQWFGPGWHEADTVSQWEVTHVWGVALFSRGGLKPGSATCFVAPFLWQTTPQKNQEVCLGGSSPELCWTWKGEETK